MVAMVMYGRVTMSVWICGYIAITVCMMIAMTMCVCGYVAMTMCGHVMTLGVR